MVSENKILKERAFDWVVIHKLKINDKFLALSCFERQNRGATVILIMNHVLEIVNCNREEFCGADETNIYCFHNNSSIIIRDWSLNKVGECQFNMENYYLLHIELI